MRGKHGASAAKRRAESAEEQLDRLLPKLIDAERLLKRYRSEAEAAPILRAELAKLRGQVGIPVAEHEAALKRERDDWDAKRKAELYAWKDIMDELAVYLDKSKMQAADVLPMSNAMALRALRTVPRELADHLLRHLGMERTLRRFLLEDTTANRSKAENNQEILQMAMVARSAGIKGGIPASWIKNQMPIHLDDEPEVPVDDVGDADDA